MPSHAAVRPLVLAAALLASGSAFATKAMDDKLAAVQKDAKYTGSLEAIKTACGCEPKVSIAAKTYGAESDMNRIGHALESAATAAKGYCSADKYKKAFCGKIKSIGVSFAKDDLKPKLEGGKLELFNNSMGYSGDKHVSKLLEPLAD